MLSVTKDEYEATEQLRELGVKDSKPEKRWVPALLDLHMIIYAIQTKTDDNELCTQVTLLNGMMLVIDTSVEELSNSI
jgi:hypothetical protein